MQHVRQGLQLIEAISGGNHEQIDALLRVRLDLDVQQKGDAAVHMAARKGMLSVIRQLRKKGDDIGKQNQNGFTAVHYAAMGGFLQLLEYLKKCGVDLNVKNKDGDTPLHVAVIHQTMDVIEELVEHGMDPNARNKINGRTPVHTCAYFNRMEAMEGLLISGANPAIADNNNLKAEELTTNINVKIQLRMFETMAAALKTGLIQAKGMKITHRWVSTPRTIDRVGIIIESIQIPTEYPSVFYCRREKRENTTVDINIRDDEEVISDIFHIRVSDCKKDAQAQIYLPLYESPTKTEQMVLMFMEPAKTTTKIDDYETRNETNYCLLQTTLVPNITCVCVVCVRPRLEHNEIDGDARMITSEMDESFSLDVPAGAFEEKTVLSLQVFKTSRDDEMLTDEASDVSDVTDESSGDVSPSGGAAPLLLTDVYQINLSGEQPQQEVTVQIPLCAGCETMDDVAIIRTDERGLEDKGALDIVDCQKRIVDCNIIFSVSHFCIYVACPNRFTQTKEDLLQLQRQIADTRERRKPANFFVVVLKKKSMKHVIIVECGRTVWLNKRLAKWREDNYVSQDTRSSQIVMAAPGDDFYIDIQGQAQLQDSRDSTCRKMTFSTWRSSYQPYHLLVPNRPTELATTAKAEVVILRKRRGKNEPVASLPIVLLLPDIPPPPSSNKKPDTGNKKTKKKMSQKKMSHERKTVDSLHGEQLRRRELASTYNSARGSKEVQPLYQKCWHAVKMWSIYVLLLISLTYIYTAIEHVEVLDIHNNELYARKTNKFSELLPNMTSTTGELPRKKAKVETDYNLCIKCQTNDTSNGPIIQQPLDSSYKLFIQCLHIWEECQDPEYIPICERFRDATVQSLRESRAKWHTKCYAYTTSKQLLKRANDRYHKALESEDSSQLHKCRGRPPTPSTTSYKPVVGETHKITRSQLPKYDKKECFFCQGQVKDTLIECESENIGTQIREIVTNNNNQMWKVNHSELISTNDPLSKDLKYHKICMTRQWKCWQTKMESTKTSAQPENDTNETVSFVAAEMEFYSQLEERIESGEFIPITEAESDYNNAMRDHSLKSNITRKTLRKDIHQRIQNVEFTHQGGQKATLIHSTAARDAAVCVAASNSATDNIGHILKCAKVVRQAIENATAWNFEGSLTDGTQRNPKELTILLKWIIQGQTAAKMEDRAQKLKLVCDNLAQQIIQSHTTKRQVTHIPKQEAALFRNRTETPLTVGMSLYCYHATRSKKLIELLSKSGIGIHYDQTMKHVNTIACAVQQNITDNGTYIPPGLVKAVPLRAALDNIDAKVDTPDGKSSFHALAGTIFQNKSPISDGNMIEHVTPAINVDETSFSTLKNITVTGIELVECTIIGNPKPKNSPHYPDFKPMSHTHSLMQSAQQDMAWLLIRHYSRKSLQMDLSTETTDIADIPIESSIESFNDCERPGGNIVVQSVPVWTAYNSMLASSTMEQENTNVDNVHPLPLINSPPQDWKTLVTSLEQLHKVNQLTMGNDGNESVCVWLDMDLYKRVLKLAYLKPELYKDKWLESPGQFHICLCAIRCLGRTVEGSGLDDMWVEAGVYSNVTVMQIINGKHYNRAIECHQFTLEVLASLWFDTFFEENPNVLEILRECANTAISSCETHVHVPEANTALLAKIAELNLVNLMEEFDTAHDKYPNYKWLRMYMRQVSTLLQLLRSIRLRQWDLYLASLEQMCIWFFAYNRLDYAMNIPEYVARMYSLRETHPTIWNHFEQGYFTVNTNKVPFSAIGVDQAQEHVNRVHKGDGGIIGITNNPNALMKYCLSTPELTRLSKETENMLGTSHEQSTHHHDMSRAKVVRKEKYIAQLKGELSQTHPFDVPDTIDGNEHKLVHMTKKIILPDNVAQSILDTEKRGKERYIAFVEERICGDKNLWDKMTKGPILGWDAGTKQLKTKVGERELVMKESSSMMARLLVIARSSREIDLKTVIGNHEFSTTNRMLMTPDGQLHPCSDKSQLIHRLTDIPTVQTSHINPTGSESIDNNEMDNVTDSTIPENACLLIDGMAIVQEQTVFKEVIHTCSDLADRVIRAVHNRSSGCASTCIVFDNYTVSSSLKESTRIRRAKGRVSYAPTFKILDDTQIKDFSTFLASSQTKDMLTIYLSRKLVNQLTIPTTTVTRVGVLSNSVMTEDHPQGNHEEADTLLILHATGIHKKGVPVHIYSPDTDVLVLAVAYCPQLGDDATMVMGTSSNHRHIPLRHIYNGLGENRARALIGFHALSGCDTTGRIFGKSKTAWWNTFLSANDTVLVALQQLGNSNEPHHETLRGCEEFICQLLSPTKLPLSTASELRWQRFCTLKPNQGVETLPPTQGAIHEHIKRAHLQCSVWQQSLVCDSAFLDPTTLGWSRKNEQDVLRPVLTLVPPAPVSVLEMVKCCCVKSMCSGRCSCKDNTISCTELCTCHAQEDQCRNLEDDVQESDDSETEYM